MEDILVFDIGGNYPHRHPRSLPARKEDHELAESKLTSQNLANFFDRHQAALLRLLARVSETAQPSRQHGAEGLDAENISHKAPRTSWTMGRGKGSGTYRILKLSRPEIIVPSPVDRQYLPHGTNRLKA